MSADNTTTLRRAYQTITAMQHRIDALESGAAEPIAVVGVGCRFPGGSDSASDYWRVLTSGVDAVSEVPADRFDADRFYDPVRGVPGKSVTRWGGFLDHIDRFDHDFFGISRREASVMDPQQRLALEVAWQAFEHAGIPVSSVAGTPVGVFIGASSYDYATEGSRRPTDITAYSSSGTAHSVIPGRIAYVLNFTGPAVAIDTACSSSLVAIHQACLNLRADECDVALAGGVNVVMSPLPAIAFSQFGMMSGDGRARTFDAAADGCVRGEGAGLVVLKRLQDARRDGDRILAVVRGGAVNQDGRSSGFTAPNGSAQRECIRRALRTAAVDPMDVAYVECHGTGTPLGDPIEVEALGAVYGRAGGRCYLGSAKTNISHLEAAAGVAGFIKVVLSLDKGVIAPNLHFSTLNPHIDFDASSFAVATTPLAWPQTGPRRAAVSSFGFSGTNAHLILEQAPAVQDDCPPAAPHPTSTLTISARSGKALDELARRYLTWLPTLPDSDFPDACLASVTNRSHLPHRLALVADTKAAALDRLECYVEGWPSDSVWAGCGNTDGVVFVFTGHGSQHPGMTRHLYDTCPTYRSLLDEAAAAFDDLLPEPLLSFVFPDDPTDERVHEMRFAQPALFAVEWALAGLWQSWGVRPAAVIGHSIGELAAACVAGIFDLKAAARLVAERGRLLGSLPPSGAMAALELSHAEADLVLRDWDGLTVAAVNSPRNVTVAGPVTAIDALVARFDGTITRATRLAIATASHSAHVDPIRSALTSVAETLGAQPPAIAMVSNISGDLLPWDRSPAADYWGEQLRMPVRFAEGITRLHSLGYRAFVEIGPGAPLLAAIGETLADADGLVLVPSARPRQDEWRTILSSLARLYAAGLDIDWRGFTENLPRPRVDLPAYPFEPTSCPVSVAARAESEPPVRDEPDPQTPDDDLCYTLEWEPAATGPAAAASGGIEASVVVALAQTGSSDFSVDPRAATGAPPTVTVAALPAYLKQLRGPLRVLLMANPGEAAEDTAAGAARLAADLSATARALHAHGGDTRLWVLTQGAVTLAGERIHSLAGAALWGLGRALAQEVPSIWGGLLDLDPSVSAVDQLHGALALVLATDDAENQLAVRKGTPYAARLRRVIAPSSPLPLRADAAYLVTGGFGGVAQALVRGMIRAGARRFVLLGRTPLPPRAAWSSLDPASDAAARTRAVTELEALGATVTLACLDIADGAALAGWLDRYTREARPAIRGLVHTAGAGALVALDDLTEEVFADHLHAKVAGADALATAFTGRDLDFFLLCSSQAATLSSAFTGAYAAANAALDARAVRLRDNGIPATSIQWGLWPGMGLAAGDRSDIIVAAGLQTLETDQAVRLALNTGDERASIMVTTIDWQTWGPRYLALSPSRLLTDVMDPASRTGSVHRRELPDRDTLCGYPPAERAERLAAAMAAQVAGVLAQPDVDPDRPLFDLGLDSLMALELKNHVERRLSVAVPVARFLGGATVADLATFVCDHLDDGPAGQIPRVDRGDEELARILLAARQEHPVGGPS